MTTIVIGLAAVVVLILVVVLLALRYLKAEDRDDFEDIPDERGQARGSADDRGRRVAVRQPSRGIRPPQAAGAAEPRRPAERSQERSQRAGRDFDRPAGYDARDLMEERGGMDERGGQRTAAKYDDRRDGDRPAQRRQESLPAVRPRPARGKRAEDDGDWPSTKWDQLSDVDYWAQVASDKPLTTTAQPAAQARPARPAQTRGAEARPANRSGAATERAAAPRLPVRGARQPAPAAAAPPSTAGRTTEFFSAPHVAASAQPQGTGRSGAEPGLAGLGRRDGIPPGPPRPAAAIDDDPLTSPSFPRIPAADSRSYHGGRSDLPPSGSRGQAPYAAATQQFATYPSPSGQFDSSSGQFDSYRTVGRQPAEPAPGFGRTAGTTAGHASPPPYRPTSSPDPGGYGGSQGGRGEQVGLPAGSGGYQAGSLPAASSSLPVPAPGLAAPAGNPYGSYVGPPPSGYLPSPPADGRSAAGRSAGYGEHSAESAGQRESSYSQPTVPGGSAAPGGPSSGWYPEHPAAAPPPPAYLDVSQQLPSMGIPAGGYLNGNGHAEQAGYPGGQYGPPGYLPAGYAPSGYPARPHDPAGYAGPDPYGHGRDPYARDPYGGGYPGYGAADG
jgi:hypothetical protein